MMTIYRRLFYFVFLLLSLVVYPAIGITASDLTAPKISEDGRVAVIPIDPDNIESTKDLLSRLQGRWHDITVELYTPVGLLPRVVILGDPTKVKQSSNLIQEMFLNTGAKHIVIISATLRQITESDAMNIGLKLIPSSIAYSASFNLTQDFLTNTTTNKQGILDVKVNDGVSNNIFSLDEGIGKGKIVVASEVFTPNGVKAQISDIQHMPIFSTDVNSNVQTQYQDLETSIAVTPTVIKYEKNNPDGSTVRLDIGVKMSTVSGSQSMGSVTAPQYSDKKFQTTRVFPADGKTYLVGTLVSDTNIESRSGIPFLLRIPLLRYFFSQETTTKNRNYVLLSLAVKVIPADESPDKFTIPWFQRTHLPAKGKTSEGDGFTKGKDNLMVPGDELKYQPPQIPKDAFSPKP